MYGPVLVAVENWDRILSELYVGTRIKTDLVVHSLSEHEQLSPPHRSENSSIAGAITQAARLSNECRLSSRRLRHRITTARKSQLGLYRTGNLTRL